LKSKPSAKMDIPEILTMVMRYISRSQQAVCCQVSRFWHMHILPLAYEEVEIDIVNHKLSPALNVIIDRAHFIRTLSIRRFPTEEFLEVVTTSSDTITAMGLVGMAPPDTLTLFPRVKILSLSGSISTIASFLNNCPNLEILEAGVGAVEQQEQQDADWMTARCPRLSEVSICVADLTDRELAGAVQPNLRRFRVQGKIAIGRNTFSALQAAFANLVRIDFYGCIGTPAAVARPILLHCPQLTHFLTHRFKVDSFYEDAAGVMLGDALTVTPQVAMDRSLFRNWLSTRLETFQVHQLYWSEDIVRNNGIKAQLLRQNTLKHLQMEKMCNLGGVSAGMYEMMPGENWPISTINHRYLYQRDRYMDQFWPELRISTINRPNLPPWMNQHWPNLTTFRSGGARSHHEQIEK
ncbi:hypothetical protein BGZ83_011762, partial [Gryganskiella cystojenkinii]